MKWMWFNFSALIVFCALVLNGAPPVPILAGIAGAAVLNRLRLRRTTMI